MNRHNRLIAMASGVVPECSPPETVEAAAKGGFDAVGLWVEPETGRAKPPGRCAAGSPTLA